MVGALLAASTLLAPDAHAYRAKVVSVVDGDTVRVKKGKRTRTVALAGVAAPQSGECFADEARARLAKLLRRGAKVRVKSTGGSSGVVKKGRTHVNRAMVKGGYARAASAKGKLGTQLAKDATAAEGAGRGLWTACAPVPAPGGETPGGGTTTPGGGTTQPAAPGDVTGQPAIDQMTAELRDGFFRTFSSSGDISDKYELNLCGDGRFRYLHDTMYTTPGFSQHYINQRFGNPWSVREALIKADGSYRGAIVVGTFNRARDYNGDDAAITRDEAIDEPVEIVLEWQNGQWYAGGKSSQHYPGQAFCDPNP